MATSRRANGVQPLEIDRAVYRAPNSLLVQNKPIIRGSYIEVIEQERTGVQGPFLVQAPNGNMEVLDAPEPTRAWALGNLEVLGRVARIWPPRGRVADDPILPTGLARGQSKRRPG